TAYPYGCPEQKSSMALALLLASDLGRAFNMGNVAPAEYRAKATALLKELPKFQCSDGGFGYWPGCRWGHFYLTNYVLHVMKVGQRLGVEIDDEEVVDRALNFVETMLREAPPEQVQWLPAWTAAASF